MGNAPTSKKGDPAENGKHQNYNCSICTIVYLQIISYVQC